MNKYRNTKTVVDGITFDSKREAQRYKELKLLEKAGTIEKLVLQPSFELQEKFKDNQGKSIRAITYIGDFLYSEDGRVIVEDVKGLETEVFKLKTKMFKYKYRSLDIELRIVK